MEEIDSSDLLFAFSEDELANICNSYDVTHLGVFGSTARGESTPSSDVDFLVEFDTPKSLVGIISLQNELAVYLGRDVDLLTKNSLSPYIRDEALSDLKFIYVKR